MMVKEFALAHPVCFTILVIMLALFVYLMVFEITRMVMRSINIGCHGWPPPHLDAGGNNVKIAEAEAKEEQKEEGGLD